MSRFETQVLVVGAGPVGLTLAMDLAWRGIRVVVAELRQRGEAPPVKCNHVAARSMEIFRRLGVARALRDAGLPPDSPNDIAYRITATGEELAESMAPFMSYCIEQFGPNRCMFESNFPVDKVSYSYNVLYNAFKRLSRGYSAPERAAMFQDTAVRVYRVSGVG